MKKIIFLSLFLLITFFLFIRYNEIIIHKTRENIATEYNKKYFKNIDIFFVGNSAINWTMSPMYIWNKYGILSYNRGIEQQSIIESLNIIKNVLRTYKPKIIVYDIFSLYHPLNKNLNEISLLNMLQFPYNIIAYKDYLKHMNNLGQIVDMNNYNQLNITNRFHNRWKNLGKYDFSYSGFNRGVWPVHYIRQYNVPQLNTDIKEINPHNLKIIDEIYALAEKSNCKVLFVRMPNSNYEPQINFFKQYAKKKNWIFLNYNDIYEDINLNYSKDFEYRFHLNIYGSRKVMDHLIPYLIKNYDIPNRKNDPEYAFWNNDYIKYERYENMKLLRGSIYFSDWKQRAFYDNCTVLISTNGDVLRNLPDKLKNDLKSFGLNKYDTNKANVRYVAIIDDNKVFFEEVSDKPVSYKGRMKNIVNLYISSENNRATINVSGKPRSKNRYGLNFVIYDKTNREIIDSIWIDPKKPDEVRR